MCAGPNGLLGLIAQNQFENQHGDETILDLEQLLRTVKARIESTNPGTATDVDKNQEKQLQLSREQVQRAFQQQMEPFLSSEKGAKARREEMMRIATWAEKKSAWPEGLLQKVASEASRKLSQGLPKSRKKKDKTARPKSR